MTVGTLLLIVGLVIILIFDKIKEYKNWEVVFECNGAMRSKAEEKFAYLKSNGVRCRLKTPALRQNVPIQSTISLLVHKKDYQNALKLLSEAR